MAWNIQRVPHTLADGTPHPGRTCGIFVVHGIGEQLWTATAAQLRSGFEDALAVIEKWQIENGFRAPGDEPDVALPPPFIFEGYWANYEDIEATFPEDWARFNERERQFFEGLWKHRVFSVWRTLRWFVWQQLRLLSPRVLSEVGLPAWILYLPLQVVSLATLAIALVRYPKVITGFLTDVRLYLDPRGVVERSIVERIDARVRETFLKMIGLDQAFRELTANERIEAGGERLVFDRVVWVAHSLGTVISYNVLCDLFRTADAIEISGDEEQRRGIARWRSSLRRFVTMGSPLDKVAFLFGKRSLRPWPEGARRRLEGGESLNVDGADAREWWVNFYHVLDPVSGALQSPVICAGRPPCNYHLRLWSGIIPGLAHVAYWTDVGTLRYILGRTYGIDYLRDKEFRARPPWVLTWLAIGGYLTWAGVLFGSLFALYRWGPTVLRAVGEKVIAWVVG